MIHTLIYILNEYNLTNILNFQSFYNYSYKYNYLAINTKIVWLLIIIFWLACITLLLYQINKSISPQNRDLEKLLPYECGFDIFQNIHNMFELHFYIICLLYIAFDIEILIILPFVLNLGKLTLAQFYSTLVFFFFLIWGYYYEYKKKIFFF